MRKETKRKHLQTLSVIYYLSAFIACGGMIFGYGWHLWFGIAWGSYLAFTLINTQ